MQLRAFGQGVLQLLCNLAGLPLIDEWRHNAAMDICGIQCERVRALHKQIAKCVEDTLVRVDAFKGHAGLSTGPGCAAQDGVGGGVDVRIGQHHGRILAAQFKARGYKVLCRLYGHQASRCD